MQVPVEGASVFVRTDGDPGLPALLLIPGARCTTAMWDPVMAGLVERFHVIRHDVRGHGRSRLEAGAPLGLDRYAADAAAVLDAVGVTRAAVWGMAFGARVALAFAHAYPGRLTALALFDASAERPDPAAQKRGVATAAEHRASLGVPEVEPERRWFHHDDPDAAVRAVQAAFVDVDHDRYVHDPGVPVLVATGQHDANLPASRRLHRALPGSRLVELEAVSHGSVLQRPELCLRTFVEFMDGVPASPEPKGDDR